MSGAAGRTEIRKKKERAGPGTSDQGDLKHLYPQGVLLLLQIVNGSTIFLEYRN